MIGLAIDLLLGGIIGYVASTIMKLNGKWYTYVILGILGSLVGGLLAGLIGISAAKFSIGGVAISILGSCVVIYLFKIMSK